MLYLDERGNPEQHRVLEEIWAGRVAGEQLEHFPWAWKPSHLLGVEPAQIELDHTPRRQWFRVRDTINVSIAGPYEGDETVTCVIPGHDQPGQEVVADELDVRRAPSSSDTRASAGSLRASTTRAKPYRILRDRKRAAHAGRLD